MLSKFKIGTKLIAFFLIIGIVPLIFMGILSYNSAADALKIEAENKLEVAANLKKVQIESMFDNIRSNMNAISSTNDIKLAITALTKYHKEMDIQATAPYDMSSSKQAVTVKYAELYNHVHSLLRVYPEQYGYYDIFIICAPHGHVMYTWAKEADLGTNLSSGQYRDSDLAAIWKGVNSGKDFIITDTQPYAPSNGAPAMFAGAPIKDNTGKMMGVVALQVSQDAIDEIMQEATGMGETGETYLVGSDYLFRSNSRLTSDETLLKTEANTKGPQEAFRNKGGFSGVYGDYTTASEAKQQGRDYSSDLGGVPVAGKTIYLPDRNWVLVAEVDEAEALAAVYTLRNTAILTVLIAALIIALVAYFISKTITDPIKTVVALVKDIATGEGDLTVRLGIDSKDELGELATWFDTFVEKLQKIISQVKNSAKEVATAGSEISTASEQMAAGAEEQQAQLSEVATSIEEMSAMILETSNNAEQTQGNANEANLAAEKGADTVNQTISGIEGIASIVSSASDQIRTLKIRSQEIADVIQVIDDISDQTNLLALNANIEAARAGEAGRGFAVVADEVRKLAERTVGATADIEEKIKQIQTDVNSSVEAMEQITTQSQEGQTLAGEAGSALGEISGSIEQVNAAISQIASAAIEQSAGVEEISKNVESVSTVSKQSASGAQELAASSEQLNREVQGLDKLMDQFKV